MIDHHARSVSCLSLVLMLLASGLSSISRESFAQTTTTAPDPLVFDTWVPGPCSPNGQPQGNCPPGDLFRVRLVAIAEGLKSPRHMAFTPDEKYLMVTNGVSNDVSVIDVAAQKVIKTIQVGELPWGITIAQP